MAKQEEAKTDPKTEVVCPLTMAAQSKLQDRMAKRAGQRVPDPKTEPDQHTVHTLNDGQQFTVFVKPKERGKTGSDYVCLARINGVAYWCKRGEKRTVPIEVARIAFAAGVIDSEPPPNHRDLSYIGNPLPELNGTPS